MIQLENISKIYSTRHGAVRSLAEVNLKVKPGEFLVIRGPSGCGKTTLLLTMGGMLRPTSGRLLMEGHDLYGISRRERNRFRAEKIGFVFQMFHLVPYLNVLENVLLAGQPDRSGAHCLRASQLLTQLGLEARAKHKPEELSAGERQRTALARALLNMPKIILADEPSGNLDPENGAQVFRHLGEFHRAGGTVIVVTHGQEAEQYADRLIEMRAGSITR